MYKRIFVLGASGFIGKNIILKLNKKKIDVTGTYFKNFPKDLKKNKILKDAFRKPITSK